MSATTLASALPVLTWTVTVDRDGFRTYVSPTGQSVAKDGAGRMVWTVTYADGSTAFTDTLREAQAWAVLDEAEHQRGLQREADSAESARLICAPEDGEAPWSPDVSAHVTYVHGAPVVDWDAILDMPESKREAALIKVTGVRPTPDVHGHVTGMDARREAAYDYSEPTTATAIDAYVHARGTEIVSSPRDAVRHSAHVIPDGPDAMRTALVLSALMHGDVVTKAGKANLTALALALYGDDVQRDARGNVTAGQRFEVRDALDMAIGHLADGVLAHLDSQDRDATTRTLTHRLLAVHDGRVVASMDEVTVYVTPDAGSDDGAESGWTVPASKAERRERRNATRVYGPYRARVAPTAPEPLPVHTIGARRSGADARGMVSEPAGLPTWMRYARAMTRGTSSGQGYGTDEHGNRSRDALRRVPLQQGFTIPRERLLSPLTGGSWVEGPVKPAKPVDAIKVAKIARAAKVARATSSRDALRARLAR